MKTADFVGSSGSVAGFDESRRSDSDHGSLAQSAQVPGFDSASRSSMLNCRLGCHTSDVGPS